NGDGLQEILVGTVDGKLRIFSPEGEQMPGTEVEPGQMLAEVADLNGDGAVEMLVGSTGGVLTSTPFGGRPTWTFANYGYGPVDMAIGDVDRDNQDEIALASDSGYLYVLGPEGDLEFTDRADGPVNCVAIGNLMDKRRLAICYGSDDGSVYIVGAKGERRGQFWVGQPIKRLALADLTGDGLSEIIAAGPSGDLHVLKYEKGAGVAEED
ncbi:MAG: FG-GAP repeat domain-containing protein, partial [Armatimonadota bacterium]